MIQRVILAHEIAHSVLHTNITAAFHEFTLFDDTDRQEYEANLFAAELLLSDDCVLNALNEDHVFVLSGGPKLFSYQQNYWTLNFVS